MEDRSPQDRAGIYARWVFGPELFFGERLCLRIPARRGGPAPWETPREHSRRSPGPEIARESLQPVPPVARSPSISALVPQLGLSYIQSIHLSSWHVSRHCSHVRFTIKAGIMFCYICKVTNAQCMAAKANLTHLWKHRSFWTFCMETVSVRLLYLERGTGR